AQPAQWTVEIGAKAWHCHHPGARAKRGSAFGTPRNDASPPEFHSPPSGYSAALRTASHSRSAWASRGETSGYSGSEPTLGRIFQERAHFLPSARRGSTATPGTSSSRKASLGP